MLQLGTIEHADAKQLTAATLRARRAVHSPSVGFGRTAEPGGMPTAATRTMAAVLASRDVRSRLKTRRCGSARRARWQFGALAEEQVFQRHIAFTGKCP